MPNANRVYSAPPYTLYSEDPGGRDNPNVCRRCSRSRNGRRRNMSTKLGECTNAEHNGLKHYPLHQKGEVPPRFGAYAIQEREQGKEKYVNHCLNLGW